MNKSKYVKKSIKTKKTKKTKYVSRHTNKLKLKNKKQNQNTMKKIHTISREKKKQEQKQEQKQNTVRMIIFYSPSIEIDAKIYRTEFIKQGYKVDFKIIEDINHNHIEKYYDINLFLENLPFECKKMFPAKTHLFMPNNELFIDSSSYLYNIHTKDNSNDDDDDDDSNNSSSSRITDSSRSSSSRRSSSIGSHKKHKDDKEEYKGVVLYDRYEELKSIDFVLCKTKICETFFNFLKNENKNTRKYKYETIYTKFTTTIGKELTNIFDNNDPTYIKNSIDPNLFVHLAGKSPFKNTPDLVHCWIKNKGFLNIDPDIKLVVTCYDHCSFWFNKTLIKHYKYDFEKDPDVNMNYKTNIATYKNMKIYFKPVNPYSDFINIITKANVAICISNKEGYGHYINEVRYMKKFIITLDYPPMNELVKDKGDKSSSSDTYVGNGIVLKNKTKFIKKAYKETKFNFSESYPDIDELRDSIVWCIKHKHELRKWGENGRKMFLDDKKYFEDVMEKFIENKL
jgi:hypothetical protein